MAAAVSFILGSVAAAAIDNPRSSRGDVTAFKSKKDKAQCNSPCKKDKDCMKGANGGFIQCPTCWQVGTLHGGKNGPQCGPPAKNPPMGVLEFEFFTDGRTVTLLECYASEAAHQRHFARWASNFAGRMSSILVLKDIHIYGRGVSAVPRGWEPFMSTLENPLERNHKGPVGKI